MCSFFCDAIARIFKVFCYGLLILFGIPILIIIGARCNENYWCNLVTQILGVGIVAFLTVVLGAILYRLVTMEPIDVQRRKRREMWQAEEEARRNLPQEIRKRRIEKMERLRERYEDDKMEEHLKRHRTRSLSPNFGGLVNGKILQEILDS